MRVVDSPAVKNAVDRVMCAVMPLIEINETSPKNIAIEIQGYYQQIMQSNMEDGTAEFPVHVTDEGLCVILNKGFQYDEREFLKTVDSGVLVVLDNFGWAAFVLTWESDDKMFLPTDHDLRMRELNYWLNYEVE